MQDDAPMSVEPKRHWQEYAARFHGDGLVVDVHCDVHLDLVRSRAAGERQVLERRHLPAWRAGGVGLVVLNTIPKFGPDPYPYVTTPVHNYLYMLDCLHQELDESPHAFALVRTPSDVAKAQTEGKLGIIIGVEGAEPLGTDLSLLRCYHRLGLRVLTLTWHHRNSVADGVSEPSASGLSNFGREVVSEANRLGIVLDVSHAGPRAVRDTLARSSVPIMASHSNARALCDHERNLHDDELRGIAEQEGLIGVTFLGRFVADDDPTLEDVVGHVEHLFDVVGPEHVALGTDYTTGGQDLIIEARRVGGPDQPTTDATIPYARGLESYDGLPALAARLIERGHTQAHVDAILGGNFLRLFSGVSAAAAHAPPAA